MSHYYESSKLYVGALVVGKSETSALTSLVTEGHYHFLPVSRHLHHNALTNTVTYTSPCPVCLGSLEGLMYRFCKQLLRFVGSWWCFTVVHCVHNVVRT